MSHQIIHISPAEDNYQYAPASPTDSYASTEALYIPAPGTPYQTTSSTGALPLVEDPAPTNTARVLAVDLAIGATQPAIPLSPRAVSALVEGQTDALTTPILLRMVRGLILTAKRTEDRMEAVRITAEEQAAELEQSKDQRDILALGARTLQLECDSKTESLRLADLTIRNLANQPARADIHQGIQSEPPAGFVENNGQLHYFSIPLQGGSNDRRIAPYIQLLDGPVPRAAGTLGGPDDPVFTTEVYAQPSSNIGVANPPVPKWLLRAIDGTPRSSMPSHWRSRIRPRTGVSTPTSAATTTPTPSSPTSPPASAPSKPKKPRPATPSPTAAAASALPTPGRPSPTSQATTPTATTSATGGDHPLRDAWSRSHLTGG
jgi:hypothetical protein